MKLILVSLLTIFAFYGQSQEKTKPNFNRWSIDGKIGMNNPVKNFTPKYNTPMYNLATAGLGVRYMFNAYFGLSVGTTFNRFQDNNESPDFSANHGRFELMGVFNVGNALKFYEWTDRFGLLARTGIGFGRLTDDGIPLNFLPLKKDGTDRNGTLTFGLTPQVFLRQS